MKVSNITFTGADDDTSISELVDISTNSRFVEWGILFPSSGGSRFPSLDWVHNLTEFKEKYPFLKLSAHMCGKSVNDALNGNITAFVGILGVHPFQQFSRIQLNFHGLPIKSKYPESFNQLVNRLSHEIIIQMDGVNDDLSEDHPDVSLLYDTSSGAGVLPYTWPSPMPDRRCGYAGGLGPDNLKAELEYLDYFLPENTVIWIDMETNVRTNAKLDLDKVKKCIDIVEPYICQP